MSRTAWPHVDKTARSQSLDSQRVTTVSPASVTVIPSLLVTNVIIWQLGCVH